MPKRRFLRYGLRTFLAVITVLAVLLGRFMYRVNQQNAAVAWVKANGGVIYYDYQFKHTLPPGPAWLRNLIGIDGVSTVTGASIAGSSVTDISPLVNLKSLKSLRLNNTPVSDLSPLANLKTLEELFLRDSQVSDLSPLANLQSLTYLFVSNAQFQDLAEPLAELRKTLPKLQVMNRP